MLLILLYLKVEFIYYLKTSPKGKMRRVLRTNPCGKCLDKTLIFLHSSKVHMSTVFKKPLFFFHQSCDGITMGIKYNIIFQKNTPNLQPFLSNSKCIFN